MFIATLYIIARLGSHQDDLHYPDNGALFSAKKLMSYQAMGRHGGHFNTY
jgi:hypothetical protein